MKKFFVFLFVLYLGLFGKAQDISYNHLPFDCLKDTFQITAGLRFGSMSLSPPPPEDLLQKKIRMDYPKKLGIGNFIMDARFAVASDSLYSHDGVLGLNVSFLRSKVYLGYQYSRPVWYSSFRFGYEVYRMDRGKIRGHTKLFSENIPLLGFEFGYTPKMLDGMFRLRFLSEYDFGNLGWYSSGIFTTCLYKKENYRFELGSQYDGLYGYGVFASGLFYNTLVYFSSYQGQLPFQETRFPEQNFGMEKGFSFGIQQNFR